MPLYILTENSSNVSKKIKDGLEGILKIAWMNSNFYALLSTVTKKDESRAAIIGLVTYIVFNLFSYGVYGLAAMYKDMRSPEEILMRYKRGPNTVVSLIRREYPHPLDFTQREDFWKVYALTSLVPPVGHYFMQEIVGEPKNQVCIREEYLGKDEEMVIEACFNGSALTVEENGISLECKEIKFKELRIKDRERSRIHTEGPPYSNSFTRDDEELFERVIEDFF